MSPEEAEKELLQLKEEIELLLEQLEKEIETIKDNPQVEQSDAAELIEEKQDFRIKSELLKARLRKINSALERIKQGNYGICLKCHKKIEEVRLKIDPTTEVCRKCSA